MSQYLLAKAKIFLAPEEDRLKRIKECLRLLKSPNFSDKDFMREEEIFCISILAMEYSLGEPYETADKTYNDPLKIKGVRDSAHIQQIICDLIGSYNSK
ncbi:MAG: hypothetical protein O2887_16910 [Bacteroidetes bacterium]|nr:hypothetical protein [Bacteroidota bacterium]MDA1122141.1 hypothetical protein [Bacteroidota bacterium]